MSRSIRHTPIFGIGKSDSQDWWKRHYNRDFRRKCAEILGYGRERFDLLEASPMLPLLKDVSDPWDAPCDGWHYWVPRIFREKRGLRVDDHAEISIYRRLMRK